MKIKPGTCVRCFYWEAQRDWRGTPESWGVCRRFPPGSREQSQHLSTWPTTSEDDWCGEFSSPDPAQQR